MEFREGAFLLNAAGGSSRFVFRRTVASACLTSRPEYDLDLEGTWTPAGNGTGGVMVTEEPNGFGGGVDRVTVNIPASGPSAQARLRVVP